MPLLALAPRRAPRGVVLAAALTLALALPPTPPAPAQTGTPPAFCAVLRGLAGDEDTSLAFSASATAANCQISAYAADPTATGGKSFVVAFVLTVYTTVAAAHDQYGYFDRRFPGQFTAMAGLGDEAQEGGGGQYGLRLRRACAVAELTLAPAGTPAQGRALGAKIDARLLQPASYGLPPCDSGTTTTAATRPAATTTTAPSASTAPSEATGLPAWCGSGPGNPGGGGFSVLAAPATCDFDRAVPGDGLGVGLEHLLIHLCAEQLTLSLWAFTDARWSEKTDNALFRIAVATCLLRSGKGNSAAPDVSGRVELALQRGPAHVSTESPGLEITITTPSGTVTSTGPATFDVGYDPTAAFMVVRAETGTARIAGPRAGTIPALLRAGDDALLAGGTGAVGGAVLAPGSPAQQVAALRAELQRSLATTAGALRAAGTTVPTGSVQCPAKAPTRVGATLSCTGRLAGTPVTYVVTARSTKGQFTYVRREAVLPTATAEQQVATAAVEATGATSAAATCGKTRVVVARPRTAFACTATAGGKTLSYRMTVMDTFGTLTLERST